MITSPGTSARNALSASTQNLIGELEPVIVQLLDNHLATAREWFPHEYVPWGRARDLDPARAWCVEDSSIGDVARVALVVNLLTEDNLPYYFGVLRSLGRDGAWAEWTGRWTAEEGRHAIVIRDYLTVTRAVDPVELERGRMQQVSCGVAPQFDSLADTLVYVTLQELATRISHRNTGKLIDDPIGVEIMNRVAADENLHHLFYRDLVTAAIEIDPSTMVKAIDRTVCGFTMPGTGISDFARSARLMASAHVYDFAIHYEQVVVPIVLQRWGLERITGLDAEAQAARDHVLQHIARLGRVAARVNRTGSARSERASAQSSDAD